MEDEVKKDILIVLRTAQVFLKEHNFREMGKLSEATIHNASTFQDPDSINIAVLIYALSKIMERVKLDRDFQHTLDDGLKRSELALHSGNLRAYNVEIEKLGQIIANTDKKVMLYIDKVMEKAQLKKGRDIYEHGISLARTAQMLGIGQWELASYLGKTKIHDMYELESDTTSRLAFAKSLFSEVKPVSQTKKPNGDDF